MPSACFVYGWSEGPWQSRQMRKVLELKGFKLIKDAPQADVIIAHSLGCYLVPLANQAKIVLLIGLPYWPDRSIVKSVLQNIKVNLRNSRGSGGSSWWLNKLLHNCWYALARPMANYQVLTRRRLDSLPKAGSSQKILLIRNSADTFTHPDIQKLVPIIKSYQYIELAAPQHEDCWLHPELYVQLIEKYYG